MKVHHLLLLSIFDVFVQASPARSDCGETKTFSTENACGDAYDSTWVECANGMTSMPTFTIPPCSVAIVDTTGPIAVEREVVADPVITPAPTFTDPLASNASNDTTSCRDLWVCADAIAVCGEVTSRIKSCYNTCTDDGVLSTPPCTIPPKTTATITSEEGPRSTLDICEEQAWMCAPDWW